MPSRFFRRLRALHGRLSGVQKCRHLFEVQRLADFTPLLKPVQALLTVLAHATQRELARQLQYRKNESRVLRDKLPKRITITPRERARLLKFGRPVGTTINRLITLVAPATFAHWVREAKGTPRKIRSFGWPQKLPDLRKLILKIGRETGWGYSRVLGEIGQLTRQKFSRQSVANIM